MLDLLQIADSAFPTGGYAHSLGLEGLYAFGDVDLLAHCRFILRNTVARVELPVVRLAARGESGLDELLDALTPVKELRDASRSMGRSFRRAMEGLGVRVEGGHFAVVYGRVLRGWHIDVEDGSRACAFGVVRQQLLAAQRMGKIGQSAVQGTLHTLKGSIEEAVVASSMVERDEIGGFAPMIDIASMGHAHQPARLFLS